MNTPSGAIVLLALLPVAALIMRRVLATDPPTPAARRARRIGLAASGVLLAVGAVLAQAQGVFA